MEPFNFSLEDPSETFKLVQRIKSNQDYLSMVRIKAISLGGLCTKIKENNKIRIL